MMNKTILTYGAIGGILVTLLFLGLIVFSADSYMDPEKMKGGEVYGYSVMIVCMLSVFFGVRAYGKKLEGTLSFLKALGVGLQITVVACLLFYLGNVLLYEVISPNFLTEFGDYYKEYMMDNATSEAEKAKVLQDFEQSAAFLENGFLYALLMAGTTLFIGIIISLISAITLKQKQA